MRGSAVLAAALTLGLLLARAASAQESPALFAPGVEVVPAAIGEMVEIALPEPGARIAVTFTTAEPGTLRAEAYFPPPELGTLALGVRDAAGDVVATGDRPGLAPPGDYALLIAADGHSAQPFTVKVELEPPLDPFEPNDVRAEATPIELPFRAIIQMDPEPRADWFVFDVEDGGVLIMHLSTPEVLDGPMFRLLDEQETELYATAGRFDYRGARYAALDPGRYWFQVWDRADRGVDAPDSHARLTLELRQPATGAGGSPGISAVGLPEESPEFGQLAILGLVTGIEVLVTVTAEDVAKAIESAIGAPDRTLLVTILLLLALAAATYATWRYRHAAPIAGAIGAVEAALPRARRLAGRAGRRSLERARAALRFERLRGLAARRRSAAPARPATPAETPPADTEAGAPEIKSATRTRWRAGGDVVPVAGDDETPTEDVADAQDGVPADSLALLEIVEGPGAGIRIYITETEARLGRGRGNEVRLNFGDDRIHREGHGILRLYPDTSAATLSPARDEPVTHVNGEPLIAQRALHDGDRIALGKTVLRFTGLFGSVN